MHELSMHDVHCQIMKVSTAIYLKLSKFSDIWINDKTHNKFLDIFSVLNWTSPGTGCSQLDSANPGL